MDLFFYSVLSEERDGAHKLIGKVFSENRAVYPQGYIHTQKVIMESHRVLCEDQFCLHSK